MPKRVQYKVLDVSRDENESLGTEKNLREGYERVYDYSSAIKYPDSASVVLSDGNTHSSTLVSDLTTITHPTLSINPSSAKRRSWVSRLFCFFRRNKTAVVNKSSKSSMCRKGAPELKVFIDYLNQGVALEVRAKLKNEKKN